MDLNQLERWLRKMLQAIGLRDCDGWDGAAVCDQLHGRPTIPSCPTASPRCGRSGWPWPLLPLSKLAEVHRIEHGSRHHSERGLGMHSPTDPHRWI